MGMLSHNSLARSGNRSSRHHWNFPAHLYNRSLQSLEGQHAREDAHQAFLLNAQAAETGMHDAVLAMGWFYLNGFGVDKDLEKAERWYKKSARHGEPMAMFSLGVMACDKRDYADALIWFRRAAEKGHRRSVFWIGKLHWRGSGVPKDQKKALALFHEAANNKVEAAQRAIRFLSRHRQ